MSADVTAILGETSLLRSVPAEDLKAIAAASRLRGFRRGQVVFTRSDPGDTVIVVVSGRVKVVVRSADGGALTLAIIGPGGVFGEVGVVDQSDVGQPIQHPGADIVGVSALGQLSGQLGAGTRPRGEQAQAQRPRLLFARWLRNRRGRARRCHRSSHQSLPRQCRAFP